MGEDARPGIAVTGATGRLGGRVARLALRDNLPPSRIAIARAASLPPTATATAFLEFCVEVLGDQPPAAG